ncbi:hypothetical protein C943_03317 [Mariniradius saccharolyticus AK6]|uniref:Uncharacterized protein n=1 Tax=Mariniradius saccharolyticus AK6 TaxID=1239962 RepID=M7XB21_9BACT|nr:hypothetical protein [Mariniradius saccharolyticus]EMS34630.1 hypothetical protein C943_03317 [Mariniradius saccharolyticus AK6]
MFWIKINKQKLQLPDDFKVDLIIEQPLTMQDRIPVPYTTSFDIAPTPYNRKLLGHPERVNKRNTKYLFEDAEIGYGAVRIYRGSLQVKEVAGRISAFFQASDDLDKIRQNMNEIDLGRIEFGVPVTLLRTYYEIRTNPYWEIDQPNALVFDAVAKAYKDEWLAAHDNLREYAAAPIRVEGSWPTQFFDGDLFHMNTQAATNLFFNGNLSPIKLNIDGITIDEWAHAVMFPQIRASYFIEKILGIESADNPFRVGELNKIVITSYHHPNFRQDIISKWKGMLLENTYPVESTPAELLYLDLKSYQPAIPANEMLKSLLNLVCGTMFRIRDSYVLKLNKDVFADSSFEDWDKILGSRLQLGREDAQAYIYGYSDMNEDEPKIDTNITLADIEALHAADVDEVTGEQLYYVTSTNQIILKKLAPKASGSDPDEFIYEVKGNGVSKNDSSSGYTVIPQFGPLKMAPVLDIGTFRIVQPRPTQFKYMPIWNGTRDSNFRPHLMIYWGLIENPLIVGFEQYPYLSYHNYGPDGTRLGDLSLAWDGDDGLIPNYHQAFKDWIETDKLTAYGEFILSPNRLKDLDLSKKVNVRNKLWYIKKMTVPLTKKKIEPALVDLVEADPFRPTGVFDSTFDNTFE